MSLYPEDFLRVCQLKKSVFKTPGNGLTKSAKFLEANPKRVYLAIALIPPAAGAQSLTLTTVTTPTALSLTDTTPQEITSITSPVATTSITLTTKQTTLPFFSTYAGTSQSTGTIVAAYASGGTPFVTTQFVSGTPPFTSLLSYAWAASGILATTANGGPNVGSGSGSIQGISLTTQGTQSISASTSTATTPSTVSTITGNVPSLTLTTTGNLGGFLSAGNNAGSRIAIAIMPPISDFTGAAGPDAWWVSSGTSADSNRELNWPVHGPLTCQEFWWTVENLSEVWQISVTEMIMLGTPCKISTAGEPWPGPPESNLPTAVAGDGFSGSFPLSQAIAEVNQQQTNLSNVINKSSEGKQP
jgi:hypothetical protein